MTSLSGRLSSGSFIAPAPLRHRLPTVPTHIVKEWHEHRTGLLGMAAIMCLVGLALSLVAPPEWIELRLVSGLTLGTMICAVVLFAPDLAEQRQQTLGLLERLPGTLHAVFWAKALFLLGVIAGFTGMAYLLATILRAAFTDAPLELSLLQTDLTSGFVVSTAMATACWLMATSWWLPRSMLAIPVTAILLALIILPGWLLLPFWYLERGASELCDGLPITLLLVLHPVLALAAAWWSLAGGRRHGRGPSSSAWRTLAVASLTAAGLASISASLAADWNHPPLAQLRIEAATIGADGRHAFARAYHRGHNWPSILLAINLQTGGARRIDDASAAMSLQSLDPHHWRGSNPDLLFHWLGDPQKGMLRILDTNSCEVLAENHHSQPYRGIEDRCRAALRQESPITLPDGRKCWRFDGKLQTDDGTGYRTLLDMRQDRQASYFAHVGFGLLGMKRQRTRQGFTTAYDFLRERRFDIPEDWTSMRCLAAGWIAASKSSGWILYDPVTGSTRVPAGIESGDQLIHATTQGQLIVLRPPRGDTIDTSAFLFRIDIDRGSREPLDLPGVTWTDPTSPRLSPQLSFYYVATTPFGRDVFRVSWAGQFGLTTLQPGAGSFSRPVRTGRYAGTSSESTLITVSQRGTLEQVDLETGSKTQLFPAPTDLR